jgi:hypothetical protein
VQIKLRDFQPSSDLFPSFFALLSYIQGDTKKRELLKCIVAAMYIWQHCGRGTLSYRHPRHSVIMDQCHLKIR